MKPSKRSFSSSKQLNHRMWTTLWHVPGRLFYPTPGYWALTSVTRGNVSSVTFRGRQRRLSRRYPNNNTNRYHPPQNQKYRPQRLKLSLRAVLQFLSVSFSRQSPQQMAHVPYHRGRCNRARCPSPQLHL